MRSLFLAASLLSLTACVDADVDDIGELDSSVTLGGPTTLSLFESSNATGKSLVVDLAATDGNEKIRLISKSDISAAGLLGKVSAVRLKCGNRDARVVLFDKQNTSNTVFSSWSHTGDTGFTINCTAGTTRTINLHTAIPALADNVGSAFLTTHAELADHINFMDYFESAWGVALDQLPSEATPTTTDIWMTTTNKFEIRQHLSLDHWICEQRGALFEYSVTMHADGTFSAVVVDAQVGTGFGDIYGCHDQMLQILQDSLADSTPLTDGLDQLVGLLAPNHHRYYFVPDVHLWSFDLFFGDPIILAPPKK